MAEIEVTVKDGAGNVHALSRQQVYEIRSALGFTSDQGRYGDEKHFGKLLKILPPPCCACDDEDESNWQPMTEERVRGWMR